LQIADFFAVQFAVVLGEEFLEKGADRTHKRTFLAPKTLSAGYFSFLLTDYAEGLTGWEIVLAFLGALSKNLVGRRGVRASTTFHHPSRHIFFLWLLTLFEKRNLPKCEDNPLKRIQGL